MVLYPPPVQLLIALVAAHALGDFVFQTRRDVESNRRPGTLFRHAIVHAALAYALAGRWTVWVLPLSVFLSHAVIDAVKSRVAHPGARAFLIDQAAHLATLAAIAGWCGRDGADSHWADVVGAIYFKGLVLLAGAVLTVLAGGYLIGLAVRPFLQELESATRESDRTVRTRSRGFANGGQVIGRLERALILLLVLTGNPAGVGFLFAAKSILRFGEIRDPENRMEAEYIIIGTLMSFGFGVLLSYLTRAILLFSG